MLYFLRNNLAAVAFPETAISDLLTILIVVKDGSSIERLENLRGKSACFPEYGGIGELFIDIRVESEICVSIPVTNEAQAKTYFENDCSTKNGVHASDFTYIT